MKIKLDFEKKEIEVIGKVIVIDLFEKIEELGLDVNEWNFVTSVEYLINSNSNKSTITSYPAPIPYTPLTMPDKIWY